MEDHPSHGKMQWTACYVDDCRIHNDKRYQPRRPFGYSDCRWCGKFGHHHKTCTLYLDHQKKEEAKALASQVPPEVTITTPTCSYCKDKGHLPEVCHQRITDNYKLLNTIHSNTKAIEDVSIPETLSLINTNQEQEKRKEKSLPTPPSSTRSTKKLTASNYKPPALDTENDSTSESELSQISSSAFDGYDHTENAPGPQKHINSEDTIPLPTYPKTELVKTLTLINLPMISDPDWMTIIAQHYHTCLDFQHIAKYPQLYILDTHPKYSIIFSPQLELALISKIAQNGSKQLCIPSNCRKREQDGTIIELRETLIQNCNERVHGRPGLRLDSRY